MAALTANRNTPMKGRQQQSYPVEASTHIYKGSLVGLDASGYLVPMSATTGLICVGRARKEADNSTGAAGAIICPTEEGVFQWGGSGFTVTSVGALVYALDDNNVTLTATGHSIAGVCMGFDANGVWVYSGIDAHLL